MSGSANPTSKLGLRQKLRQSLSLRQSSLQASTVSPGHLTTPTTTASTPHSTPSNTAVSSTASSSILTSQQQQVTSSQSLGQLLLARAIQHLSSEDHATLQHHTSSVSGNIQNAIEQAITAATEKRKICLDKRWSCTVAGRHVLLREKADKVVHWLDRFKPVGDIAANADPIHIGLPWAGIRLLLEAVVAESNQMAALLVGCESALYMASRLQVYTDFMHDLSANLPRNSLEESIVLMYAHVLQFLARAIHVYQKSTIQRVFSAIWKLDEIVDFEQRGEQLAAKVERDASNCDRFVSAQDRKALILLQQNLQTTLTDLQQLRYLQASVERLHLKIDLDKIPYSKGAIFNSVDGIHSLCHPATRVDLLAQVKQWAQQPDGKSIFWLHGAAGAGKSTISWTFAQWLTDCNATQNIELGASFFFKRGEGDRGSATRFFPTIVRQLIMKIPGLDVLIADVVNKEPFIFDRALAEQFRRLLSQPLQHLSLSNVNSSQLVIVVDALDECENEKDVETILQLWSELSHVSTMRIRLFLTSRPDQPLRLQFRDMSKDLFDDIVLQDAVPQSTTEHDLLVYLRHSFSIIQKQYLSCYPSEPVLGRYWPGDDVLQSLVAMAVPLFIVAATVCRFVGDLEFDPIERLEEVLIYRNTGQMAQMEMTYLPVLSHLTASTRDVAENAKLCEEFRTIVGSIVCLAEPLSVAAIGSLLNKSVMSVERRLARLHSVLRVPHDRYSPVQTLHLSFAEFLLSEQSQSKPFGINGPVTHLMLLKHCLRLLSSPGGLRKNICDLDSPGHLRQDVDGTMVEYSLSPPLQYACRHWVQHCEKSTTLIKDNDDVHTFLQKHFLHWLEALSLMNRLSEAVKLLRILQSIISTTNSVQLSSFLEDGRRFVLANRDVADLAPLQIYYSATTFAPQNSLIREICGEIPKWMQRYPPSATRWGFELQKLEGHTGKVCSVSFSPDNALLASASVDKTVRLWKVETGQEVQKLEGDYIQAVAFSPDGALLALASEDIWIRLWHVKTGRTVQTLQNYTGSVKAVAFSPDGGLLASASRDKTVTLWEVATGEEIQCFRGHTWFRAVSFSPDGKLLASASDNSMVQLWDVKTKSGVQQFQRHTNQVRAVTFSRDGTLLASALDGGTVRLWELENGREGRQFPKHGVTVSAVAFSSDGTLLVSASDDKTVRLWDIKTGAEVQRFVGHSGGLRALAFSHDDKLLASGSLDKTVRLWEVKKGQDIEPFEEDDGERVNTVAFSCDGRLLASVSSNSPPRLWEVETGREVPPLERPSDYIEAVAFSRSRLLLSKEVWDQELGLWEVTTGQEAQKLQERCTVLKTAAFSYDNKLLMLLVTIGCQEPLEMLTLPDVDMAFSNTTSQPNQFTVEGEWIRYNNQNLLWLPHEYRGASAAYGHTIAIGTRSGRILFFRLGEPTEWPALMRA